MQKKKLIAAAVAVALQTYYCPAIAAENNDDDLSCPADIATLSKEQRDKLPATCLAESDNDNSWGWIAGGAAALIAGVAVGVDHNDDNHSDHNNVTPTPPDDGGDVTPDDGDDDGGDVTPPEPSVTTFSNGVTLNKGGSEEQKVLTFDDVKLVDGTHLGAATLSYSEQNGQWQLATKDGKTLNVAGWNVTDSNAAVIEGTQEDGRYWKYDSRGYLILASDTTQVATGDNATNASDRGLEISGDKEIGAIISGDNTNNTLGGNTHVSNGATGIVISGDGTTNNITGNATVDDATGTLISGDDTQTTVSGATTVTGGGTGMIIDGDNTHIVNTGNTSVDGAGSIGTQINGDKANLTQSGDLLVTGGAFGVQVNGKNSQVINKGNTTVRDADSIGFQLEGDGNIYDNEGDLDVSLLGTGAVISGDNTHATLDGNINIHAEKDSDGIYRGATGISVIGSNTTTEISGNVDMTDVYGNGDMAATSDALTGVMISGTGNDIVLDGEIHMLVEDQSAKSNQALSSYGLNIQGDGNTAEITGGVDIDYTSNPDTTPATAIGININGASTVTMSGQSTISSHALMGISMILASVENRGTLILDENSDVTVDFENNSTEYIDDYAVLLATGTGSTIENKGSVSINGATPLFRAEKGAHIFNSGKITALNQQSSIPSPLMEATQSGSLVENTAGGNITLTSTKTPSSSGGISKYPLVWSGNTYYAMLADEGATAINDKGASITLQGAGVYGVSASKGTAINAGDIYVDGFQVNVDDEGNITSTDYWKPANLYLTSTGMVAGSTDSGHGNATATNTGTITVDNAGFGMMALNGGTAINQGTITLNADEGVQESGENQLVGMVALNGGTVVNDTTGSININASYGKPFYTDSSSLVINYGEICVDGACQDSDTYNPTDDSVSIAFTDGDVITAAGKTLTDENLITDPTATETIHISNAGTLSGGSLSIRNHGEVTNETTGNISKVTIDTGGVYINDGTTATVSVDGGVFNNTGTVTGKTSTTVAGSVINNSGSLAQVEQWSSTMNNTGLVSTWQGASSGAVFNNEANGVVDKISYTAAATINNAGTVKQGSVDKNGTFNNLEGGTVILADNSLWSGQFNNWGTVNSDADIATSGNAHTLYNGGTGVINGQVTTSKNNSGSKAINDGTININKTGNVAMSAHGSAKMVNNGIINVGTEGTDQTNMVGMQLESDAKADGVVENNRTINVYASNSYAFSQLGSNGHIVNNGTVYIDDSATNSGFIKQTGKTIEGSGENGDGNEVHYVDFTAPTEPEMNTAVTQPDGSSSSSANSSSGSFDLSGYVVGTSADGSAGQLKVNNASMNGVGINTGFTAGTADTTVTFDNVVEGENLTNADAIQSTSVVWNAQGTTDTSGNVDVTMTKNAYTNVVTDSSVSDVAQALDAGYTNNELYTSLNVGTTAELNSALKQISGSQATTVFREARVLSNRFNMLADAAEQVTSNGLAFNVVAKGDPRAELGNDTQYDMLALRQKLDLTGSQNLTLEYGIARLDGDGSSKAGDNGVTGGYSQFFGLKHSLAFENGLDWNNALRYDIHNLDSSRSVAYSDVNKVADSDARQQYLEFRSEGAKTFNLSEGMTVTPYAGVKFRHTMEDGYSERSADDFNLTMNAGSETAVDSVAGLKLSYAGKNGWSANMTLEGGPNLSYSKSQRTASLQGAAGQQFGLDDGQKGGGVNGLATVGVKYSSNDSALHLDAYQWKEDGISDKGFMLNVKKTFR